MALGSIGGTIWKDLTGAVGQVGQTLGSVGNFAESAAPNLFAQKAASDKIGGAMQSVAGDDSGDDGRTVYVLFGGLGSQGTGDTANEAKTLESHGVSAGNIIQQPSPFPAMNNPSSFINNLADYEQAANPNSSVAQSQEKDLEGELQADHVQSGDKLEFIGYSAGGQEAATEAGLIDKDTKDHVNTVVSMGTPYTTNNVPKDTRLVVAESQGDPVLNVTDSIPGISRQPSGYNGYSDRLHIELPANNAQGQPNTHGSYIQPNEFWSIVTAANSNQVDQGAWTHPNQSLNLSQLGGMIGSLV
ncbi:MAG TPA: hypothetical protein VGO93_00005 [Candidatus Xenobia bacterium]|jgi:hypothetical protein